MTETRGTGPLLTPSFAALIGTIFLCYAQYFATLPMIPLLVLSIGGDAALIGLVVAALSFTSLGTRAFIGHVIDRWSLKGTLGIGALILGATGLAYTLPGLPILFLNRLVHGVGWAAINTAGGAAVASLAPPSRRGEAAGYLYAMPGLAQAIMPAVALAMLPTAGFTGAFAVAGILGLCGTALVSAIRLPPTAPRPASAVRFWSGLLDPTAFRPMLIEALSSSAWMLFFAFTPLRAIEIGVPVQSLSLYFTVMGATTVIGQLSLGRIADRVGRDAAMAWGGFAGVAAVALFAVATDLPGLAAAGLVYSLGRSLVSPATFALAVDRMDPARRGASFATYSMAYQLANGFGGFLWGVLIQVSGFRLAFVTATLIQALVIVLAFRVGTTLITPRADRAMD